MKMGIDDVILSVFLISAFLIALFAFAFPVILMVSFDLYSATIESWREFQSVITQPTEVIP